MEDNLTRSKSMLDTTDCLEAVGVFRGWKNLFFVVIVLCILVLQACFWLTDTGLVPIDPETTALPEPSEQNPGIASENLLQNPISEPNLTTVANTDVQNGAQDQNDIESQTDDKKMFWSNITFEHLTWIIKFSNAILILTAFLFCLSMFFSLTISLLGRLGGINHITRAFFLSIVVIILILPWQNIFGEVITGAVFSPEELIEELSEKPADIFDIILHYVRFSAYFALMLMLTLLSQIRSGRWAKAILRRLELI